MKYEITKEEVRAAGGIVHGDGNIFFTNIEQLNAAIARAARPAVWDRVELAIERGCATAARLDAEQAAFEVWLADKRPSGDHEAVQRQWLASSDYADLSAPQAAQPETCELVGIKVDGTEHALGSIPVPARMKFRELLRSYFGRDVDDEDSDAAMALFAFDDLTAWQKEQAALAAPVPARNEAFD